MWDAEDPCSPNTPCEPESSFPTFPRKHHGLCLRGLRSFGIYLSRPMFFNLLLVLAQKPFLGFLLLDSRHAGKFFKVSHSLSTAASASRIFICLRDRNGFVQQCGLHDPFSRSLECGIFVIHELPFHAHESSCEFLSWHGICFPPMRIALLLLWRYL